MADTQITGTLSADEAISGSLTANEGIDASLAPDEEVSGALEVKRTRSIPTNLNDLGDVNITSPQDGQVMKYNGLTDEWENTNDEDSGVWGSITGTLSDQTDLQNALDAKISSSEKGSNNGVATLDVTGRVPSSQLPSFVDDVLEYASLSAFPATGEAGKIYVALDTNKTYRWSGSTYVEVSESLALGETTGTAYEGSKGKANADAIAKAYKTDDAAETAIADNDYFPFYDTSAMAKRKTLWSNIKAKLKAYFDGIYSTFSGSYNDLTNKPTVDKVKQNTNTAGSGGHNLLAAVTSETTAETNYVEKTADMKYYPYYRELRLTDTNGSVWTMPHGLAYGLITGVYNMDAGDTLRFPSTGTDSHIHTDCIAIPVADSKSDGTGYKFRSLKVYNGYAELVLGEDTPAATVHVGFLIYDFTTRHV